MRKSSRPIAAGTVVAESAALANLPVDAALSVVSQFLSGDERLPHATRNAARFLGGLREKMLDEDVAAGIRLWHTKHAVYHFDKEAMEQLEATVKGLQAKSFDVAVSPRP